MNICLYCDASTPMNSNALSCGSPECKYEGRRQRSLYRKIGQPPHCAVCGSEASRLTCGRSECKAKVRPEKVVIRRRPKANEKDPVSHLNKLGGMPAEHLRWAVRNPRLRREVAQRFSERQAKLRERMSEVLGAP